MPLLARLARNAWRRCYLRLMTVHYACFFALILAASCGKAKQAEPKAETSAKCDDRSIETHFQACKASLLAYTNLKMPFAEADCETLRLFAVDLAPLAQDLFRSIIALKRYSQSQSDACRERNREKYGAEMGALMNELAKSMGPEMDRLGKRVQACSKHPGMAEAFEAASFPSEP